MRSRSLLLPALALGGLSLSAAAQSVPDRWLVTTTSDVTAAGVVDGSDAALLRVESGQTASTDLGLASWLALAGLRPSDVDAVGLRPGQPTGHRAALAVSLLSNEGGFLDGDVLGLSAAGGFEVLVAEHELAAALGLPDAAIDVDAFDWDADGQLRFSLQADLAGTSVGDVSNGDVLRLEADGSVSLIFSEEVVQVAMEAASGQSGAIGDVHGLTVVGDDTWVVVQGPSAVDGVPLRLGDVPVLATDEASLGLGGAELDGVVALDPSFRRGSLAVDADLTVPGASIVGSGAGFEPLSAVVVVATGSQAPGFPLALGGFGELWLDHMDPVLATPVWPVVATDASGRFSQSLQLPPGQFGGTWQGSWGWSFQALDLTHLELSPPVRIEL